MVIEWRKWWNGGMAEWRNGRNGGMAERWSNGGNGYIHTIYGTHTHTDDDDTNNNNDDTLIFYSIERMVRKGQSYAVDSKCSIDLKTQFVAHVSIR